jgi:ABC-type multidrug transport system permease subunit
VFFSAFGMTRAYETHSPYVFDNSYDITELVGNCVAVGSLFINCTFIGELRHTSANVPMRL